MEKLLERKIMDEKGTDKPYVADSLYTVQPVILNVCIKFQNPRSSSS